MGNRPATVKQADLARYIKAALAAGLPLDKINLRPDGVVELIPQGARQAEIIGPDPDELLR